MHVREQQVQTHCPVLFSQTNPVGIATPNLQLCEIVANSGRGSTIFDTQVWQRYRWQATTELGIGVDVEVAKLGMFHEPRQHIAMNIVTVKVIHLHLELSEVLKPFQRLRQRTFQLKIMKIQ